MKYKIVDVKITKVPVSIGSHIKSNMYEGVVEYDTWSWSKLKYITNIMHVHKLPLQGYFRDSYTGEYVGTTLDRQLDAFNDLKYYHDYTRSY